MNEGQKQIAAILKDTISSTSEYLRRETRNFDEDLKRIPQRFTHLQNCKQELAEMKAELERLESL